jgi:hypothetical protein
MFLLKHRLADLQRSSTVIEQTHLTYSAPCASSHWVPLLHVEAFCSNCGASTAVRIVTNLRAKGILPPAPEY